MLQPSDRKTDVNQQIRGPKRNEPFGAPLFHKLKWLILNHVQAGEGISINRVGERTIISARNAGARGMGATGGVKVYVAETKAELPDASTVPVGSFGRVDGVGSDNGMLCVVNPDKDGWDAVNFFE